MHLLLVCNPHTLEPLNVVATGHSIHCAMVASHNECVLVEVQNIEIHFAVTPDWSSQCVCHASVFLHFIWDLSPKHQSCCHAPGLLGESPPPLALGKYVAPVTKITVFLKTRFTTGAVLFVVMSIIRWREPST